MKIAIVPRSCLTVLLLACSAPALAQNAMTAESADLYAGPDDSYPVVAQLDSNTPVQVMGCLDDWSWCDVGVDGGRGWLFAPSITYQYEGGYVPFYSYAPSFGVSVVSFSVNDYWGHYYQGRPFYGQRNDWAHRAVQHRRPPGPPPSASHPPRPEQRGGPREAPHADRTVHAGSANSPHPDAGRRGGDDRNSVRPEPGSAPRPAVKPTPRPQSHVVPTPTRPDEHSRPAGPPAPAPHESHPQGAEHPEPPHDDHPH
jgi:uncharacterized protein YraI